MQCLCLLGDDSTQEQIAMGAEQLLTASEAARALGISLDTLRRWDRSGRIRTQRDAANRRLVAASEVSRLQVRPADDLSARNRFRGVVRAVEIDGFLARVELDVTAPARVVAIITREAAEELDLQPGRAATAIVKSTSVMVER
jgi:molybdopterin-binding protein